MPDARTAPLTLAEFKRLSGPDGLGGPFFVQVRRSGSACCAEVTGTWTPLGGHELYSLWLLTPFIGRTSSAPSDTRRCSGVDGRCVCAGEVVT